MKDLTNPRKFLQSDFYAFYRYMMGTDKPTGWWVRAFCDFLQYKVYWRYLNGKRPMATIEAPVQHGKSTVLRLFAVWLIGLYPHKRHNYYTASEKLLAETSDIIGQHLRSVKYLQVFGPRLSERLTNTTETVGIYNPCGACGRLDFRLTGAGNIGHPSHFSVVDDPYRNKEEAYSPTMREKILDRFRADIVSRRQTDSQIVVVHSRWHEDDLIGWMKKNLKGVLSFCYPALLTDGSPLFPQFRGREFLNEQKAVLGPSLFEALYQQSPITEGGNVVKGDWFKTYRKEQLPGNFDRVIITADTAQKTGEENDYSVLQAWGRLGTNAYLLRQLRAKLEAPELLAAAWGFYLDARAAHGSISAFYIEDKVSGTALIQTMRRKGLPIMALQRNKDKFMRLLDVVPHLANGRVWLPDGETCAEEIKAESMAFRPDMKHKHDDMVDCMTDALDQLLNKGDPAPFVMWA